MCNLAQYIFFSFYFIQLILYVCRFLFQIDFNKQFIKHNQVDDLYCDIKYFDLPLSLSYANLFFYSRKKLQSHTWFICLAGNFFSIFSHIIKKIVLKKSHVIKVYKFYEYVQKFNWLIWFVSLTCLASYFLIVFFSTC